MGEDVRNGDPSSLLEHELQDQFGRYRVILPTLREARDFDADPTNPQKRGLFWSTNWRDFGDRFGLARAMPNGADRGEAVLLLATNKKPVVELDGADWYYPFALQVRDHCRDEGIGTLGMMLMSARAQHLGCVGLALQVLDPSISSSAQRFQEKLGSTPHAFKQPDGRDWPVARRCTSYRLGAERTAELAAEYHSIAVRRSP